jgi:hypothetical protein
LLDKRLEQRPATAQAAIDLIDAASRALSLSPQAPTLHATPAVARPATNAGNAWGTAQGTVHSPRQTGVPLSKRSWPWFAGAAVLLLGWLLWPRSSVPVPPVPEAVAKSGAPTTPAGAALYSVQISSKPAGAGVELAGVEIGKTPYVLQFRRATSLRIALDGYVPAQLDVDEHSEPNLAVELTPLAARKGTRQAKSAPPPAELSATAVSAPVPAAAAAAPAVAPSAAVAPAPVAQARPTTQRAQGSALPSSIPPPSWLSKVPLLSSLTGRERREAMLRRGPPYRNVVAAKTAYRAGQLSEEAYEDTIWVLKTQRSNRIQIEKSNYKRGLITRDEYDRRVDRIDADYQGQ